MILTSKEIITPLDNAHFVTANQFNQPPAEVRHNYQLMDIVICHKIDDPRIRGPAFSPFMY